MIDFDKNKLFKLSPIPNNEILEPINKFLLDDENVLSAFKSVRDQLVLLTRGLLLQMSKV